MAVHAIIKIVMSPYFSEIVRCWCWWNVVPFCKRRFNREWLCLQNDI